MTRLDPDDERDMAILAERARSIAAHERPIVGDFVQFPDLDRPRRISHVWPESVQTTDGGSFYLGNGYASYSGSLYTSVPKSSLVPTSLTLLGSVWFFHHDRHQAHNGVDADIPFKVWACTVPAPKY